MTSLTHAHWALNGRRATSNDWQAAIHYIFDSGFNTALTLWLSSPYVGCSHQDCVWNWRANASQVKAFRVWGLCVIFRPEINFYTCWQKKVKTTVAVKGLKVHQDLSSWSWLSIRPFFKSILSLFTFYCEYICECDCLHQPFSTKVPSEAAKASLSCG